MKLNKSKFKQTEVGLIPDDWEVSELGKICLFRTGKLDSNAAVTNGNFPYFTCSPITLAIDDYAFDKEAVILAGNNAEGNFNIKFFNGKFNAYQRTYVIYSADKAFLDNKYLYYALSIQLQYFKDISVGSATKFLTLKLLNNLEIKLPSIIEQQKIAEVLGTLDDKIELNRKMNKTLEALGQAIFKRWFINSDNKHFDLIKLGEKITILKGKNITKKTITEGDIPVVAGGLNPSCYHDTPNTIAPVISISASGANAGFIRLYHENVWASDCSYIDKSVTPYVFFYYLFLLENKEAVSGLQRGSAQPHVYPKDLMELIIADFDERLIQRFEKSVTPIFKKIKINEEEIETLSQIRNSLLPRLMSGKMRL